MSFRDQGEDPSGKMGLIQFQAVALYAGICILRPGVDTTSEGKGVFQTMAVEPGTAIKNIAATMIVKDDGLFRRAGEKVVLEFLTEEFRAREADRFVLFTAPDIKQADYFAGFKASLEGERSNEQGLVAFMAGQNCSDGLLHGDFVAGTDFGKGFVFAVGTGLASTHMIGGEKGSACAREPGKKIFHGLVGVYLNLNFSIHGGIMTHLAPISSVCVGRNVRIVVESWSITRSLGSTSCPT